MPNPKRWTHEDDETFDNMIQNGENIESIATELNRSQFAVACKILNSVELYEVESLKEVYNITDEILSIEKHDFMRNKNIICRTLGISTNSETKEKPVDNIVVKKKNQTLYFFMIRKVSGKYSIEMQTKARRSFFCIPTYNGNEIMEQLYENYGYRAEYDEDLIPSIIAYLLSVAKLFSV